MYKKMYFTLGILAAIFLSIYVISCSKPDTTPPALTCADKTIVINATATPTAGGTATNGSITASATGSTGFTFSINSGAFQSNGSFASLAAGTYNITAKDDAGCTAVKSVTVTATACPTILVTGVITNVSAAGGSNGSVVASASGSNGYTYSKDGTTFQAAGTFSNLTAANYTITVKDLNGCIGSAVFSVNTTTCPTISVTGVVTQPTSPVSANGAITATATNGVAPYTYSKDGTTFQTSNIFTGLIAGTYTIVAKDANACNGTSANINVTSVSVPCPTITISNVIVGSELCAPSNVGSITVTATGSTGLMYKLGAGAYQTSNIFANLVANNYIVGVIDANGCTNTSNVTVGNLPQGPLFTNVKAVLTANCAFSGCHAGASPQSGINFTDNCTIVARKDRINARAVVAGTMPPSGAISAVDKQKIIDWITAGGKYSN
jgi:large repetitive protein